ncbi:MAG: hypothetical protein V9E82_14655 [Candidatus Nanopelagicales bacterium]
MRSERSLTTTSRRPADACSALVRVSPLEIEPDVGIRLAAQSRPTVSSTNAWVRSATMKELSYSRWWVCPASPP